MARKIKFALEMKDGVKVRSNMKELRENFDLEKTVGYFLSGKLVEWLEDRYYEDEAEAIEAIDKDAPDLRQRLCESLGVEYEGDEEVDVEALERLNEKKAILRQKTGDESIIANVERTALTQEDLAYLLDIDESVIYLCGEEFTVPARIKNKKYVGILGMPKIHITANSEAELNDKSITFENVRLPWMKEEKIEAIEPIPVFIPPEPVPVYEAPIVEDDSEVSELIEIFNSVFTAWHPKNEKDIWEFAYGNEELTEGKKKIALRLICKNKYNESDLVHLKITDDMSAGWALTKDSVCFGGRFGNLIVKYKDIDAEDSDFKPISLDKDFKSTFSFDEIYTYTFNCSVCDEYELCSAINNEGIEALEYDMEELNTYLMTVAKLFAVD